MYSPRNQNPSAFGDHAFEPQSGYMFDQPMTHEDDHDFRNMQRNIAALQVFGHRDAQHDFSLSGHGEHDGDMTGLTDHMFLDQPDLSPNTLSWPKAPLPDQFYSVQSMRSHITRDRNSVAHQFGQITPPDDSNPKHVPTPVEAGASTKSERARNAANQRHAKAKKARKDSTHSKSDGPDGVEFEETDGKRERYREKNRLAAAKCRAKKKTHTEDLEDSARHITATNNRLRAEERELRDLFSSLRHQALAHDPTQGCTCSAIHMYNNHKAHEAARGAAMSLANLTALSPAVSLSMPSEGSTVASPVGVPTSADGRAPSFSGSRPRLPPDHAESP